MVGPGHRPYDALFAWAVLPGHAPGRPAQPPGASGGRDGCLVSQEAPNLRRHARRCPPRDLARTGFPHVPDRARGEETPASAARRHHLCTLPRRMTATKRPNSNLGMKPLFVRELSDPERQTLQAGLRSSDGFTVRRCHILLASARGNTTTVIAQAVGCSPQAVRNVLRAFETRGLAVVAMQSRRPHTAAKVFDTERSERLKALLHQSPRQSGKARSTWTLALAAEVCAEHGITAERVSLETIRDALKRLGVGWRRAKTWITSPDPQYAQKKPGVPA